MSYAPEGAKKVGGASRSGANDAGAGMAVIPATTGMGGGGMGAYGSAVGDGNNGMMNSGYGSMAPGAMNGGAPNGAAFPQATTSGAMKQGAGGPPNGAMDGADQYNTMMGPGSAYGTNSLYGANGMGGYGAGGYAMTGSMYGGGSMYDMPEENIIVTKVFSSRRDLGSMASGVDFPRRFDSFYPSYRSDNKADGGPGSSLYNGDSGTSLVNNNTRSRGSADFVAPTGPAGEDADGNTVGGVKPDSASDSTKPSGDKPASTPSSSSAVKPGSASAVKPTTTASPAANVVNTEERKRQREIDGDLRRLQGESAANKVKAVADASKAKAVAEASKAKEAEAVADAPKAKAAMTLEEAKAAKEALAATEAREAQRPAPAVKEPTPATLRPSARPKPVRPPTTTRTPTSQAVVQKFREVQIPAQEEEELEIPEVAPPREASKPEAAPHAPAVPPVKPRRRPPSRPNSRASSVDMVDFPKGEEVQDDMTQGGLSDPAKVALDHARAEERKQREAKREALKKDREAAETADRGREKAARERREQQEIDERHKRDEAARADAAQKTARQAALGAREREKEEEKRRFEAAKAAEAEREAARVKSLLEERQREVAKEGAPTEDPRVRSTSRPRSRRPASRGPSSLRGGIPDQPGENYPDEIRDTLDSGLPQPSEGSGPTYTVRSAGAANATRAVAAKKAPTPAPTPVTVQAVSTAPANRAAAARGTPSTVEVRTKTPQTLAEKPPTPADKPETNPIRSLVVVELMRSGNRAITHDDTSVTWQGYPIKVDEVKERQEGEFTYRSEVVHNICETASRGYNVAVLSAEAPNTVSRARSPVWSVLLRIVDTVLKSKRDKSGAFKNNFKFECALAYFEGTNAKDLLADESSFETLKIKPSPVSGPRLVNMTYMDVSDSDSFERAITIALSRAAEDTVISTITTGFIGAYLTMQEEFVEGGKKDVCFSSINVVSAGSDMTAYDHALKRERGPYGTLLHLDILGPCLTCYMLNVADDDTLQQSPIAGNTNVHNEILETYRMLERMTQTENLAMRSGSVRRFVHYIRKNQTEVRKRLAADDGSMDAEKRARMEKYLAESEVLHSEYTTLLGESDTDAYREL